MELPSGCVVLGSWSVSFCFVNCFKGTIEVNLFRPLWFTWKGKDGYRGGKGYL